MTKNCTIESMSSVKFMILSVFWVIGLAGTCHGIEIGLKIEPIDQNVNVGGNVTLGCVWNSPTSNCFWKKDGGFFNSRGMSRYIFANNAENCSLTIFGVQLEDEGRWMCEITDPISLSSKEILLSVNETEITKRQIVVQPQYQFVTAENETILSCGFSAPSPHCFWSKNGDIVVIKGRYSFLGDKAEGNCSIKIVKAQLFDDGVWQCGYPRTDADKLLASRKVNVSVIVMPSEPVIVINGIKVKNGSKLYVPLTLHDHYRISCWSENGSPAAELQWGIQSESAPFTPLIHPQHVATYKTKVYDNVVKHSLKIAHLLFYNPQMNWLWNQYDLICRASHPTYERSHEVNVHLIIGYKPPARISRHNIHVYG